MLKLKKSLTAAVKCYIFHTSEQLRPIKDELQPQWSAIQSWIKATEKTEYYFIREASIVLVKTAPLAADIPIDYKLCVALEAVRKTGGQIQKEVVRLHSTSIGVISLIEDSMTTYALLEGLILSNYKFDKYITTSKKEKGLQEVQVMKDSLLPSQVNEINAISEAVSLAKDLINEPPNILTATELSARIKELSRSAQLRCQILDKKKIEQLGMGGLLAVNRGSELPPTFTIIEHQPGHAVNKQPIVLVGKGVVYDTGGLSLKPTANSMDKMKSDMSGSAVVAGIMYVIAKLDLPLHVVALIPATDNRPGYNAYTPGDIIKMHNGMQVEVLNTDAEGRMILADAISYAKKYNPLWIADFATLTGSAMNAIGSNALVTMGNVPETLFDLAEKWGYWTNEKTAHFPFWDEYAEYLKSDCADMKNIGGAQAGAITAGKFLEKFTTSPFWHFDIAGVSFRDKGHAYSAPGATGFGIRLMSHVLIDLSKK